MPEPHQLELVDAHPRLGAPPESVSQLSFREQGYDRDAAASLATEAARERDRVAAELERLNRAYEAQFGFRYCVFVAGRSRSALLPEMAAALARERDSELHRALDAVVDIAVDRSPEPGVTDAEPYELGENRYGKSRIRLVTVRRGPERHDLRDLTVAVALEGDFDAVHTARRQRRRHRHRHDEEHGLRLRARSADRLAGGVRAGARAPLRRLRRRRAGDDRARRARLVAGSPSDGAEAPDAFVRSGEPDPPRDVAVDRSGAAEVEAGIDDLTVMKTTKSAFSGFDRDQYTTLPEVDDRLMATKVRATWGYRADVADGAGFDFDAAWDRARATLLRLARGALQPVRPGLDLDHGHAR